MNLQLRQTKLPTVKHVKNFNPEAFSLIVMSFLVLSCAAIKGPSGGPADILPPEVVQIFPENKSLQFQGGMIRIEFSEYLDERTIKNAIRISPVLDKTPEYILNKKTISFLFPTQLMPEQTYVITLGRGLTDEHGVPLAEPVQIAYSTGSTIDNGSIEGRIFSSESFSAHLWKIDPIAPFDSLFAEKPHFVAGADDEGFYRFQFLAPGHYKILTIDSRMAGLPLIPSRMDYGLPWINFIQLDSSESVSGIHMIPFSEPKNFRLIKGKWLGPDWGQISLNKAVPFGYKIRSAYMMPKTGIPVNAKTFADPNDSTVINVIISEPGEPGLSSIIIEQLVLGDSVLIESGKLDIRIPAEFDTAKIKWKYPKKKTTIIPIQETETYLNCITTHPVDYSGELLHNFQLETMDSVVVDIEIKKISPFHFQVIPINRWSNNQEYLLTILGEGFDASNGESVMDSVSTFSISVGDYESFGSLEGQLSGNRKNSLLVKAISIEKEPRIATSVVNSDDIFTFEKLHEGMYTLMIFQDSDNNKLYSHGSAIPHIPSEWFSVIQDTFEVRANWDKVIPPIQFGENY